MALSHFGFGVVNSCYEAIIVKTGSACFFMTIYLSFYPYIYIDNIYVYHLSVCLSIYLYIYHQISWEMGQSKWEVKIWKRLELMYFLSISLKTRFLKSATFIWKDILNGCLVDNFLKFIRTVMLQSPVRLPLLCIYQLLLICLM